MRYDVVTPPPPRRRTTKHRKRQSPTSDYDLRGRWTGIIIFGIMRVAIGRAAGHMRGGDDTETTGPHWGPAGLVPVREFVQQVHAWINVTTGTMTPSEQAATLQRGLGGLARTIAMRVPPAGINFGVKIGGRHIDGAPYTMFFLSTNFENLEEERQLNS
eukprot:7261702-Pyramimonas_sp.AAC.1